MARHDLKPENTETEEPQGHSRAVAARYDSDMARIVVKFDDGSELAFLPRRVEALDGALPEDLSAIEITETGLHLRWPRLGIDLYVPGLIAGDPRRLLSRTDL